MATVQEQLKELRGKQAERQKSLRDLMAEAGPELDMAKITSIAGDSAAKVAEFRARNEELDDLGRQIEDKVEILKAAGHVERLGAGEGEHADAITKGRVKSIGELIAESPAIALKGRNPIGPQSEVDIDLKTLMETSAGWAPESTRTGLVVLDAQRPVQVTDLIPVIPTSQAAVVFMEETTYTNNAAEAAEGGAYGEAAFALTEQSSTVRKIGVFLPVTDEQLEDVPFVRGYLDRRLPFMVAQRLDGQTLVGDGVAPNLLGVNNVVGIQTQAKGADPVPDAVYKAMTKVRVTGRAFPGAVVMHPNDWQDIRLLRTVDGIYIWGSPADPGPERIWGLRVAQSDAQTENTAVVGDWNGYSFLAYRRGVDVQVSNAHSDYFVKGKQAIRADVRVALCFTRPAAFATVTGI